MYSICDILKILLLFCDQYNSLLSICIIFHSYQIHIYFYTLDLNIVFRLMTTYNHHYIGVQRCDLIMIWIQILKENHS